MNAIAMTIISPSERILAETRDITKCQKFSHDNDDTNHVAAWAMKMG